MKKLSTDERNIRQNNRKNAKLCPNAAHSGNQWDCTAASAWIHSKWASSICSEMGLEACRQTVLSLIYQDSSAGSAPPVEGTPKASGSLYIDHLLNRYRCIWSTCSQFFLTWWCTLSNCPESHTFLLEVKGPLSTEEWGVPNERMHSVNVRFLPSKHLVLQPLDRKWSTHLHYWSGPLILDTLMKIELNLTLTKMRGHCYDGASCMLGVKV